MSARPQFSFDRLRTLVTTILCQPLGALLGLLMVTLVAYGHSLGGGFLWDDNFLVEHNPLIRSPALSLETFRHFLFLDSASTFYRPVQNLSFQVDYALWGLDPFGFRLTNLLLHVANGWLLYLLGRKLLPNLGVANAPKAAFIIALFWVIHPIHSAVVAYVAGRADSLAMAFALVAWLAYERGATEGVQSRPARVRWFALAIVALLAALGSKEIASIWVALFGGYLLFFRQGASFGHKLSVFGATILCLGVYASARHLPTIPAGLTLPAAPALDQRYILILRALGDYAGLLLCPTRLCMERQVFNAYGPGYNPGLANYYQSLTFIGPVFLAAVLLAAAWPGPARRARLFGAGWFLIAFLPISNLFVLNASVAEHWLYVPSFGFGLLLTGLWSDLLPGRWQKQVGYGVALGVSLLLIRTALRANEWMEREVFVTRTIAAGGDSPRMRNMLASTLAQRGDAAGLSLLRELVRQSPNNVTARLNLANNLRRQGQTGEAASIYASLADAASSQADPRTLPPALMALRDLAGSGLLPLGVGASMHWDDMLAAGLQRFPQSWELTRLRIETLRQKGGLDEALRLVRERVGSRPWEYSSNLLLGDLLGERGEVTGALSAYSHAGRLDIREAATWSRRAALLAGAGRLDEAREALRVAQHRQPAPPPP